MPDPREMLKFLGRGMAGVPVGHTGPYVAPGEAAEHKLGVVYEGPWYTEMDGFCEHTRRCAVALAATGVPVHLRTPFLGMGKGLDKNDWDERDLKAELHYLLNAHIACAAVRIHQVIPTDGALFDIVTREGRNYPKKVLEAFNARRILYCMWERTIDEMDVRAINKCGQTWTGCEAGRRLLKESGVASEKVRVVPVPWFPDDPLVTEPRRPRLPGVPRFYHIGKWEPRKNQYQMIRAFLRAFKPGKARFAIKTTAGGPIGLDGYYETPQHAVHEAVQQEASNGWTMENVGASLSVITNMLPSARLRDFHRLGDVYVTVSHGEGFDMPALDAKLVGNALLYSDATGAPNDLADASDVPVSAAGLQPTHEWYGWRNTQWHAYRLEDVAAGFVAARDRLVSGELNHAEPWRERARGRQFSAAVVGAAMRRNVLELAPNLKPAE